MDTQKTYLCIDLKSFYASVECVIRGLDPLNTNLVVADSSRTEKTICLAVSPALKKYGIPGRARLFEIVQKVKEVNRERRKNALNQRFKGSSIFDNELIDSGLELSYLVATPQMALYIKYSSQIYNIYLKYISVEDIHVYSIDEVFIDVTPYLKAYNCTAQELAARMVLDVFKTTGITATAGIGTNLYLAKVAMDIVAKHIPMDKNGVRIATLDEISYRRLLWNHEPLTDFWRVGRGYASKLEAIGIKTMGDIARASIHNEDTFYRLFGVNAELLIDHAWGIEPCTMNQIKAYEPENTCLGTGQVLPCGYDAPKTRIIVKEMMDSLSLSLVEKNLKTDLIVLTIGYDIDNLSHIEGLETTTDYIGRTVPKSAHGSIRIPNPTNSFQVMLKYVLAQYDKLIHPDLVVRRVNISCHNLCSNVEQRNKSYQQLNLFEDSRAILERSKKEKIELQREEKRQQAIIKIKKRYGKNAVVKALDLEDGATTIQRNEQIGGHKA